MGGKVGEGRGKGGRVGGGRADGWPPLSGGRFWQLPYLLNTRLPCPLCGVSISKMMVRLFFCGCCDWNVLLAVYPAAYLHSDG